MRRTFRHSLRFRLILGSATAVIVATLLAGLFIAHLYRVHTTDRFETELDHHLEELVAGAAAGPDGTPRLSDPLFDARGSGLYWQLERGGTTHRSPSLGNRRLDPPAADARWGAGMAGTEPVLRRSVRVRQAGGAMVVATIASARHLLEEQVASFHRDLTLSMAVLAGLLLLGAAALVRFGLMPVRRLSDEVDRLRHGLIERLDPAAPLEFAPLVERLNQLLDGQAQLIARARTESGTLAHHLRTPLALIADEAEQLRLSGQDGPAAFLLARCDLMRSHIDYHLTRAAAAGTRGAGTVAEVAPLVAQIVTAMARLHVDRGIMIDTDIPAGLRLPCDRGDLAEIMSNLIDNGCKWAARRVVVAGRDGRAEVRDDGPGIPPGERDAALAVGVRLDPTRPGAGLGLAATRDLLSFYDARLELDDAAEGGLSATIIFGT